MTLFNRSVFIMFIVLLSNGCAVGLGKSLHQYTILDLSDGEALKTKKKQREITAKIERTDILFSTDIEYARAAYDRLLNECQNGEIFSPAIHHATDLGFFAYQNQVTINAVCSE